MYACHHFLISTAFLGPCHFFPYYAHLCLKCSLGVSNFLEEISSLSHCCFPLFLCIDHLGRLSYLFLLLDRTLHSDGCMFLFLLFLSLNKASGDDGIPVELFQILKDDVVKVLHSICQQIWKTQQWPQDWKRSDFIPILKRGNTKECSNYHTIALISVLAK